MSEDKGRGVY